MKDVYFFLKIRYAFYHHFIEASTELTDLDLLKSLILILSLEGSPKE